MVRIITKDELHSEPLLIERLKNSVFIYPTDTIYGIGCDANNDYLVNRLREIKNRPEQPFSIIVPDKEAIVNNCDVKKEHVSWINKLPGPFTFVMSVKKNFFSKNVNPSMKTVGVRMPDHWISGLAKEMNTPIVTTSVNLHGEDFMTSIDDINPEIKRKVDYIIYEGPIEGKPSTIVHLEENGVRVKER